MYDIMHLPSVVELGYTGENGFRTIQIDMRPWLQVLPDGVASIVLIRPGETADDAYVAATTMEDGILTWQPGAGDLGEVEGYGQMEVWLEDTNEKRGKSAKCQTFVQGSLSPTSETPPPAQESWLEQMTSLKTETVTAAGVASTAKTDAETARDAAQESAREASGSEASARSSASAAASSAAHFPRVRNGNWEVWDGATETWVDTGIAATGATPDLEIGTVTTLNPDQQAYVLITGTDENPVLNFGIPRGQTGSVDEVYGTTIPVSESDATTVKQALDKKLENVYGTTVPVSESDATTVKQALDRKLETVPNMTGATAQTAGTAGAAPAPAAGENTKFLRGDATYANPGVLTVNGRSPDPVTGDIVVIEGGGSGSYGSYRLDATIPVSAWSGSGPYTATVVNSLIKSTMDGSETWLDDPTAMLGETTFTTLDGSLVVSTTVMPAADWGLHVALALNGADVLAEMDANTRAIGKVIPIITGTTNNTGATISSGEYFEANGNLYKATANIPDGEPWSTSASQLSGTALNDAFTSLSSNLSPLITGKTWAEYAIPTLSNGAHYLVGCKYAKFGAFVHIVISVQFDSAPSNVTLWTMPSGFIPIGDVQLAASGGASYNAKAQAVIDSSGVVRVTSVDKWVVANGIYFVTV